MLLSCATLSLAQSKIDPARIAPPAQAAKAPAQASDDAAPQEFKRLASVTWDLDTHKLAWVVQRGIEVNGQFVPKTVDKYEVSPSEAFMAMKNEKRDIAGDEASSLHDLLGVLSLYCVESTVWWENGGDASDDEPAAAVNAKPGKKSIEEKPAPADSPAAKPSIDHPANSQPEKKQTDKKPVVQLIPGALIADNLK